MGLFSPSPRVGDVVRLTSAVPSGLISTPVPDGSTGVIASSAGGRHVVEVDGGLAGTVTVTVRQGDLRVLERGTGVERFRRRLALRGAVRVGALVLLAIPVVQFVWSWWAAVGTFDGLIEYLPIAAVESAVDTIALVFTDPLRAGLTLALGTVTCWLAFSRWGR